MRGKGEGQGETEESSRLSHRGVLRAVSLFPAPTTWQDQLRDPWGPGQNENVGSCSKIIKSFRTARAEHHSKYTDLQAQEAGPAQCF